MSSNQTEGVESAVYPCSVATRLSQKTNRLKRDGYDPGHALHLAKEAVKFEWLLSKNNDKEDAAHLIGTGASIKQLMLAWTAIEPQWEGFQQRLQWLLKRGYTMMEAASMAVNNFDILIMMHEEECVRSGNLFQIEDFISENVEEDIVAPEYKTQESDDVEEDASIDSKQEPSLCIKRKKPKSLPFYQTCHRMAAGSWRPPRVAVVKPTTSWASSEYPGASADTNTVEGIGAGSSTNPYYQSNATCYATGPSSSWSTTNNSGNIRSSNIPASTSSYESWQNNQVAASSSARDENEEFVLNWNKAWGCDEDDVSATDSQNCGSYSQEADKDKKDSSI